MDNDIDIDEELVEKFSLWFEVSYAEILKSGGDPRCVLADFPCNVIANMVRNDLFIEYTGR